MSPETDTVVVAALDSSQRLASSSKLIDYRVKKKDFEDYEFSEAVFAIMLKKIDVKKGRESVLHDLDRATPGQKLLFTVQIMRATVTDLGIIGYIESDDGNLIPEMKRGLKILGANEYVKILNSALAIFKMEKSLITKSSNRKEVLSRLSNEDKFKIFDPVDQKFEALEDEFRLQKYIKKYVNNHPKHFFLK